MRIEERHKAQGTRRKAQGIGHGAILDCGFRIFTSLSFVVMGRGTKNGERKPALHVHGHLDEGYEGINENATEIKKWTCLMQDIVWWTIHAQT